jgi:hypothetical protein
VIYLILWEVKEALKKLLEENNETIYISDTDSCYAEDVVFQLEHMFHSLKCDFKIVRVSQNTFEVNLSN